jgi:hypothetical protein
LVDRPLLPAAVITPPEPTPTASPRCSSVGEEDHDVAAAAAAAAACFGGLGGEGVGTTVVEKRVSFL